MSVENINIIGYQFGEYNQFIGEYSFPNNMDKDEIHLPNNTTLVKPPKIKDGFEAIWNITDQKWYSKTKPSESVPEITPEPTKPSESVPEITPELM